MYHIEVLKRKNSRKYTPVLDLPTEREVIEYMKEKQVTYAGTPYVFTHIKLSDGSIITQDVKFGDKEIMCSPTKLRDRLTA